MCVPWYNRYHAGISLDCLCGANEHKGSCSSQSQLALEHMKTSAPYATLTDATLTVGGSLASLKGKF